MCCFFFFVILFSIRAHDDDARSSAPHVHSRAHVYSGLKKWFLVFASVVFFFFPSESNFFTVHLVDTYFKRETPFSSMWCRLLLYFIAYAFFFISFSFVFFPVN